MSKIVNYHGWKIYQDYARGYGPYFLNTLMQRIHKKKATNVVVTGEAVGYNKSDFPTVLFYININKTGINRRV